MKHRSTRPSRRRRRRRLQLLLPSIPYRPRCHHECRELHEHAAPDHARCPSSVTRRSRVDSAWIARLSVYSTWHVASRRFIKPQRTARRRPRRATGVRHPGPPRNMATRSRAGMQRRGAAGEMPRTTMRMRMRTQWRVRPTHSTPHRAHPYTTAAKRGAVTAARRGGASKFWGWGRPGSQLAGKIKGTSFAPLSWSGPAISGKGRRK